jgi:hypothetical protein
VPSGVTLRNFADMLAAESKKLKLHWMSLHGHAYCLRSADAIVPPPDEDDEGDEVDPDE